MKLMKKKMVSGILAGALFLTGFSGACAVQAAPMDEQMSQSEDRMAPLKLTDQEKGELAKAVAVQYDVDENEVRAALDANRRLEDIYYAGVLAKASGKSFQTVISMKADWLEVEQKLNLTEEKILEVVDEITVKNVAVRSGLDEAVVRQLMKNNYRLRDIRIAGLLAKETGKDVQSILDMKEINTNWRDVAQELGVDPEVLRPRSAADEQEDAEAAMEENTK